MPSCSCTRRVTCAAVGAAFGLAHHVADDRTDRLGVAGAHVLRGGGVGGERCGDDRRELVPATVQRRQPLLRDDRDRIPAVGDEPVEHLAGGADADALGREQADERGERGGLDLRVGRILTVGQAREQLAGDPVGERLRRAAPDRAGGERAPPRSSRRARRGRRADGRCRRSGRPPAPSARRARRAARAAAARAASSICGGDRDRDEVGLGEVAVVVRLLLGAQRGDALGGRVEVQRLLHDLPAAAQDRLPGGRSRRGCRVR